MLLCDTDGRIREVNDHLCTMTGYARDELVGTAAEATSTQPSAERGADCFPVTVSAATADAGKVRLRCWSQWCGTGPSELARTSGA